MNRDMVGVGAVLLVFAMALVGFPLYALGSEQFDLEQELGILFLPFTLVILLVGLMALDPRTTTVGGTFGNPEFDAARAKSAGPEGPIRRRYNPLEEVHCPSCRSLVAPDLTQCPRCGRARPCRSCDRPLGTVLDRPTCPACGQAEVFCNCPSLPRRPSVPTPSSRGRRIV
jgi:hypothetical protein